MGCVGRWLGRGMWCGVGGVSEGAEVGARARLKAGDDAGDAACLLFRVAGTVRWEGWGVEWSGACKMFWERGYALFEGGEEGHLSWFHW